MRGTVILVFKKKKCVNFHLGKDSVGVMLELSRRSLHPERFKQMLVGHSAIFCNTRGRLGTWGIVAISGVRSLARSSRNSANRVEVKR